MVASVTANKFVICISYPFSLPIRFMAFETFCATASGWSPCINRVLTSSPIDLNSKGCINNSGT